MMITTELTQPIVKKLMEVSDFNINIMNQEGVIVASADESRINQVHQGAVEVMRNKHERVVYPEDSVDLRGTKPGVNLPIYFHGEIIGAVGITGHPDNVFQTAKIVKIAVEALLQQQYLSERLRYKQQAMEQWVMDLINPDFDDLSNLESRANMMKVDLHKTCTMIVLQIHEIDQAQATSYEKMQQDEARIMHLLNCICPEALFIVHLGKGRYTVSIPTEKVDGENQVMANVWRIHNKLYEHSWRSHIGVGFPNRGVAGYRVSFKEAFQSLQMLVTTEPSKGVAHISEWGILRFVFNVPQEVRDTYVANALKGKKQLSPELNDTLDVFLQCDQHIGESAAKLHIHRNTLLYRLEKIKQLIGLDPRKFSDAVQLQLIRLCLKLQSKSPSNCTIAQNSNTI